MTGNFIIDTAISVAGIVFLVVLCRLLMGSRQELLTKSNAEALMQHDEPDFKALHWMADEDGRAVIAVGAGEACIIFPLGDRLVSRRVDTLAVTLEDSLLTIRLADHTSPAFRLRATTQEEAAQWSRRLNSLSAIKTS